MGPSPPASVRSARAHSLAALVTLIPLLAAPAAAQVRINEILPDPVGSDDGTERIEIYNAGPTAVDMTGWAIDDAATIDEVAVRARIPEDLDPACSTNPIIGPGEFRLVKGQLAAAWLNNSGDDVYLISNRVLNPTIVHLVTYPSASGNTGNVWSCVPNGTATFAWRAPTLCATNGGTGDAIAPAAVTDLAAVPGPFPGEVRLTWTAPGDDGASGTASAYEIKVAYAPITAGNYAAAADLDRWIGEPLPKTGGAAESLFVFGLDPDSTYHFALKTLDEVPNISAVSNSPGTTPAAGALIDPVLGYATYFGNLHSHSGYSDGAGTPAQAYAYARNTAPTPLDFLAVTDHNHAAAGMSLPDYGQGLSEAAAANDDGDFVAIYGQEWGVAANGHVNIFESPALFGWEAGNHDVFVGQSDYAGLYDAILANPPASYPPLALWCHPAVSDFNSMQVTAAGQAVVRLMCLVNGPAQSSSTTESDIGNTGFDAAFHEALRKGYRVSPTADQDNHNANWGASTESRTAVLAFARTKSAILHALAAGRNYATQDHNVVVHFSAEGHAMGQAFAKGTGVRLAVRVVDPDPGETAAQIELFRGFTGIAGATRVAGNAGNPEFHWRETQAFAAGTEAHYYLRIRMADNQNVWTGPIWVTYDPSITVSVAGPPVGGQPRLTAGPVPARGRITAELSLAQPEPRASLAVYDLTGRRVRTLLEHGLAAGSHRVVWDGTGDDGVRVGHGLYFVRLATGGATVTRRVLLLD